MKKYRIITNGKRFLIHRRIEISWWIFQLVGFWRLPANLLGGNFYETFEGASIAMQRWKEEDEDAKRPWSVCKKIPSK